MVYIKCCIVPNCSSTTTKTPKKLFLSVPKKANIRNKWLELANRNPKDIAVNSSVFICEDHFNMEKDVLNFGQYKMGFSRRLLTKVGVMPSKFDCQDHIKRLCDDASTSRAACTKRVPSEEPRHAVWLRALGRQDTPLPDPAVVCSQHFLNDDICHTENGERQIRAGAIPSTVQVCLICLDTQSKLYLMSKYKLDEAYQHLVGHPLHDQKNLKQTLCVQCAQRLLNFSKFRDKSLRARCLMMELVQKHELITIQHLETMNEVRNELKHNMVKTLLKPDHSDLYIDSSNEESRTTVDSNPTVEAVAVKREERHIPMSVDEDIPQEVVDNEHGAKDFDINLVVTKEEYMSDDEPKQMTDPLLVKPSTSKEQVPEPMTVIKYEVTFECSMCMEEFDDEDAYNCHMAMHLEETQDNQTPAEIASAEFGHSSVAPLPWGFETNATSQREVSATTASVEPCVDEVNKESVSKTNASERNDANDECESEKLLKAILYQNLGVQTKKRQGTRKGEANTVKKLACEFCKYKTNYKDVLERHMRIHTGERPYSCEICDYRSARRSDMVRHMKNHTSEKQFACELCEYKFARNRDLLRHKRTHDGDKPFSCSVCEYRCARNCDLTRHMRTHTGETPYACQLCDFKGKFYTSLVDHLTKHYDRKPFSCNLCDYRSTRRSDLNRHMETHSSKKNYSCQICGHKFSRRRNLVRHMVTHTGEKPHSCPLCNYQCARNSDLVRHMLIHSGEKPFSCEFCEYKCARKGDLVPHMRTHTGDV